MTVFRYGVALVYFGLSVLACTKGSAIDPATARPSMAKLKRQLRDGTVGERIAAAEVIAARGREASDATDALLVAVKDKDLYVQRWAVYALGKIGPRAQAASPTIISMLEDEDAALRIYSAFALCEIAPAKSITALPVLLEALWNVNPEIQAHAADLIGAIGPPAKDAVPYLAAVVQYNSRDGTFTWRSNGRVHVVPPKSAQDEQRTTQHISQREVEMGLKYSTDEGLITRVWDFRGTDSFLNAPRKACLLALGEIGQSARGALPFIEFTPFDKDPEIRKTARLVLRKISPDVAVDK